MENKYFYTDGLYVEPTETFLDLNFSKMSKERAIKLSISKFQFLKECVLNDNYVYPGGIGTCGLCQKYLSQTDIKCEKCPIFQLTGKNLCRETPYIKIEKLMGGYEFYGKMDKKLYLKWIDKEIGFLESLL